MPMTHIPEIGTENWYINWHKNIRYRKPGP